jgi:hypothetical protein
MKTPKNAKPSTQRISAKTPPSTKERPAGASQRPIQQSAPAHEDIARRAYFLAQAQPTSSDFDNWIQAETELKSGL